MTVDIEIIKQSVEYLKKGKICYEFRTTVVKELHTEEGIIEREYLQKIVQEYYDPPQG